MNVLLDIAMLAQENDPFSVKHKKNVQVFRGALYEIARDQHLVRYGCKFWFINDMHLVTLQQCDYFSKYWPLYFTRNVSAIYLIIINTNPYQGIKIWYHRWIQNNVKVITMGLSNCFDPTSACFNAISKSCNLILYCLTTCNLSNIFLSSQ